MKLKSYFYYIVDLKNLSDIRIIRIAFWSRLGAEVFLKYRLNLGRDKAQFHIVKGNRLKAMGFYLANFRVRRKYDIKYNYPPNYQTEQRMKTFRTLQRRKKRKLKKHNLIPKSY